MSVNRCTWASRGAEKKAMLSIVIPSLHSPIIDRVVAALHAQTARHAIHEIIVVGQDRYGLIPPEATCICTERPVSAAAARNLGARHASGDLLLFIDSDCIAAPDLAEQLLAAQASGPRVISGAVEPEGGSYWTLADNLLVFAEYLPAAAPGPRSTLPSLVLCLPRALFLAMGGFDEHFPGAAGEDLDFGLRLRAAGHTLHFEPRARVRHLHPRTTPGGIWRHLRSFGRAHLRVARAHPTTLAGAASRLRRGHAALIIAAALPLALLDTLRLFVEHRALRPYLRALPGVVWARTGWYWGLAEALLAAPD
jgi:GT2 family glycosyltransferase